MKRLLAVLLCAAMLLVLSACKENIQSPANGETPSNTDKLSYDLEDGTHVVKNKDGEVVFAVLPDMHIGKIKRTTRTMERVIKWTNENDVDFSVFLGDNIETGYERRDPVTVSLFEEFMDSAKLFEKPYYVIKGNHDPHIPEFETNTLITCGDVAFIGFNAGYYMTDPNDSLKNNGLVKPTTLQWLEQTLEKCKGKRVVLGCHFSISEDAGFLAPIRTAGPVEAKGEEYVDFGREKILELAEKYNIELYFSGHEHNADNITGKAGIMTNWNLASVGVNEIFALVRISDIKAVIEFRDANDGSKIIRTDEYAFQRAVK